MGLVPGKPQTLSFRGEVVEVCERQGQRLARITIETRDMLDIAARNIDDAHLGDRVLIDARVTIESIKPE